MVVGFDDGPMREAARVGNRLRRSAHADPPVAGTGTGPSGATPGTAGLELLAQLGSPAQIHKGGTASARDLDTSEGPAMAERLVGDIFTALGGRTVVVPGADAAALILPGLADSLQGALSSWPESKNCWRTTLIPRPRGPCRESASALEPATSSTSATDPASRPPRHLCRPRPDNPQLGLLDPWRATVPTRKQSSAKEPSSSLHSQPSPTRPLHPLRQKDQPQGKHRILRITA